MSWRRRQLSRAVATALTVGLLAGQVATASAAEKPRPPVDVPAQRAGAVPTDGATEPTMTRPDRPEWPKALRAAVDLKGLRPGESRRVAPSDPASDKSIVRVGPAPTRTLKDTTAAAPSPAAVDVEILDHARLARIGSAGVGLQLTRKDGKAEPGPVQVELDYSGFAKAHGGSYASRLRLLKLPACALSTPQKKTCDTKPLLVESTNDVRTGKLTATLDTDGDPAGVHSPLKTAPTELDGPQLITGAQATSGSVYVMSSTSSSDAGDYRASTLNPTGTWNVSTGSGAFTYNLPIQVPKPPAGPSPELALSYNSQAVDGLTSQQNTQAGWAGLGWDLGIGFIERRYRSCQEDGTGSGWVGDLCWDSPNSEREIDGAAYVISLNGVSSELIQDDNGTGWYHVKDDPGWRVQRLDGGHGSDDEYWVVSSQDGTRYYFGWGRSERVDESTGTRRATNSVQTVPVFGNDPGEPCYSGGVGVCDQAYRWGLDRVVDPREVETAYFYEKEKNHYRSVLLSDTARSYDAAAYPVRIEYGWASDIAGAQLPAKVELSYVGRCVERMGDKDPLASEPAACPSISEHPESYPDTPTDLICGGTAADDGCRTITGETYSPTFFARQMLWDVKTFVRDDDSSAWDPAMQYQMKYGLPNPEGVIDANLWLDYVQRKGYGDGDDITLPTININGEWRDNQLGGGVLNFRRVTQIHGDLGAFTNVTYRDYDAQDSCDINSPPSESTNTDACFKQRWVPEGSTEERSGWFKKYVVAQVSVDPGPGQGPDSDGDPVMTTTYDYVGQPAWAFPNDPLTKDDNESWTEWRGYQQVEVHTGTKDNAASTYYWLYRGLDGDRTSKTDPSATRSVTVSDGDGTTASVTDHAWLNGKVLQTSDRDGSGQSHKRTWHRYWSHNTATYDGLPDARFVRENRTITHEKTSTGWREHVVEDQYEDADPRSATYGRPVRTNDWGLSDVDDNRCTTYGYAYNTDLFPDSNTQRWMVLEDDVRHYAADCAATDRTSKADGHTVTLFDGAQIATGSEPAANNHPVDANPTSQVKYTDGTHYRQTWTAYDGAGRVTSSTDGRGKTATTVYQPATSWPVNGVKVTTPDPDDSGPGTAQSTTTWSSRLWGTPYRIEDPNGKTTRIVHDSVGRYVQVFKPSQIAAYPAGTPSLEFVYTVTTADNAEGVPDLVSTQPPKITTKTLQSGTTVLTSHAYLDGLGRTRETQTPAAGGTGRTVVSTRYDTSGNVTGTSAAFYNSGAAGSGMVLPAVADLPSYTDLLIDHAGRTTQSRLLTMGDPQIQKQTIANYHGDYVTNVSPTGERTNVYRDVFGQTTKVVEFGPSTYTTQYEYSRNGTLTGITDAKGNITTYTANWLGERLTATDPDTGTTTTTYDENGNVATTRDGNDVVTLTYRYDNLNRPLTVQNGATVLTRTTYDTATNGKGRQAATTTYQGGFAYSTEVTAYDSDGHPTDTRTTVPADGNGLEGTYTLKYGHDAAGHQTTVTYPATAGLPAETVTTAHDGLGMVDKVTSDLGGATYVSATDFDTLGRLTGRTYGASGAADGAKRTYSYEDTTGTGWLRNITTTTTAKGTVQNDDHTYDAGGQITDRTDRTTGQHECFGYDELNRISRAYTSAGACTGPFAPDLTTGSDPYQLDYTYDGIGNLQKVTSTTASGSKVRDYVYPGYSADQSAYTPGAPRPHAVGTVKTSSGNDTYTYNNAGQMLTRTVGGASTTFDWNALGRVTRTTGASSTNYVYDTEGNLLVRKSGDEAVLYLAGQEIRKTGTGAPRATRYYTAGTTTVAMREATGGNGTLTWLLFDQKGSVQLAVSGTGTPTRLRNLPFGASRGTAPEISGTDRGFLGKATDKDAGLSVLGARMYDAELGRFLSPDPVKTPYQPQNLSLYSYANNNPVYFSDPSGLGVPECMEGIITGCTNGVPDEDSVYHPERERGHSNSSSGTSDDAWPTGLPEVDLPEGGPQPPAPGSDVELMITFLVGQTGWIDYNTAAAYEAAGNKEYTRTYKYTVSDAVAMTQQFADSHSFSASLKVGAKGKAGIPLVAEGEVSSEATVGYNGTFAWTDIDTDTKTKAAETSVSFTVGKGEAAGLSPSGVLTTYKTAYLHKNGSLSYKTWSTFDVQLWKPVTYTKMPQTTVPFRGNTL